MRTEDAVFERDGRQAMSDLDLGPIREQYTAEPIPPCPVCGGELSLRGTEGNRTVWACDGYEIDTRDPERGNWKQGRSWGDAHYHDSRHLCYRNGDDTVLALCTEVESLRTQLAAVQAECDRRAVLIAFLHAGNPPTLDEIAIGFGLLPTPGVRRQLAEDICTISRQGLAAIRRAKEVGDEQ